MLLITQGFGMFGALAMVMSGLYPINFFALHSFFSTCLYILLGTAFAFSVAADWCTDKFLLGSPHAQPARMRSAASYSKRGSPTPDMQVLSGARFGSSRKAWNILVAQKL